MLENTSVEHKSVSSLMDQIYIEAENKKDLDYWNGFSQIIIESQKLRYDNSISQKDLAKRMGTKQSVISRFENMGRLPSYDFFSRLSLAFDHSPGMTLFGDYMGVVPTGMQHIVKEHAIEKNISTGTLVQELLENALTKIQLNDNNNQTMNVGWLTAERLDSESSNPTGLVFETTDESPYIASCVLSSTDDQSNSEPNKISRYRKAS